jgi:hypothetical protein
MFEGILGRAWCLLLGTSDHYVGDTVSFAMSLSYKGGAIVVLSVVQSSRVSDT